MENSLKCNLSGFTLIELLVVVLIIGILASIAVPQYTKAVEKARASEMLTNLGVMTKACDIYKLNNTDIANLKETLEAAGMELSGGSWTTISTGITSGTGYKTKHFVYMGSCSPLSNDLGFQIFRGSADGTNDLYHVYSNGTNADGSNIQRYCRTQSTSVGRTICKSLFSTYTYEDYADV